MKLFFKIWWLLLLPAFVEAQGNSKQLDSLRLVLGNAANDTIRMDTYDQLANFFYEENPDSSLLYAEAELQIARLLNLKIYEANALVHKGYALANLINYPSALEAFLEAQKIVENPAIEKTVWRFSNSLTPQQVRISILFANQYFLGVLYGYTDSKEKIISSYQKAKNYAESIQDTAAIGFANWQLAENYFSLDEFDSALVFAQKALLNFSKSDITFRDRRYIGRTYVGWVYSFIGTVYQRMGDFDSSLYALRRGEQISKEKNNLSGLGSCYAELSNLFLATKQLDSSLDYGSKAVETFTILGDFWGIANVYKTMSSAYAQQHKPDSAFAYLTLSANLNDSLKNVEKKNLLAYQNVGFDEQLRLKKVEEDSIRTQNKIRTYILLSGIVVFMVIAFLLFRNNRSRKKANELLQKQKEEIAGQKLQVEKALLELQATQQQLIQSEKMASLGELTAGIAHEIQNPLNFVNNFSEVSNELIDEMNEELIKGDIEEAKSISSDIKQNLDKINHHGKRADSIVKGMLQHSQSSKGQKALTDINALCDEYLKLAYHGIRAKDKSFNAILKTDFDEGVGLVSIVPQDIGRVVLNLIGNAFYAVQHRKTQLIDGYEPMVSVSTKKIDDNIWISVSDNGNGISSNVLDKIFQPFFTTKPTGQGTGLGLSLAYDIVKAHGGEIKVETSENAGTDFLVKLPIA